MRIVLIGSGNVATHLGRALYHSEYKVVQVYSPTLANAQLLATELECTATDSLEKLADADIYLLSVKDDAVAQVVHQLGATAAIVCHTSGTLPLSVLESVSSNTGVLYPLQTFSKHKPLHFLQIPLCVEASNIYTQEVVNVLATTISDRVVQLDSQKRKTLHVAAVFACNFTNHLYATAANILAEKGMDFDLLIPLITETAMKMHSQTPDAAQTGPARRNDQKTIQEHLDYLRSDLQLQELYKLLSEQIVQKYQ